MRHPIAFLCLFFAGSVAAYAHTHPQPQPAPASDASAPATAKDLPVHQVILYKNGIGYFEHLGGVAGNQRVAIDFTSSQLNDVLQSLTILDDNGGHIGGVNYNSTTPLAEQLKSLSLAMSDDPTSTELFQALRGQRVEVTGAPGGSITGRLMSIESRGAAPSDSAETKSLLDRYFLTLVASSGAVRVIELTPTLSVRPLDASLQGQLDRYLELLSSAHSSGLRHLTLNALGEGQRQLRVSYISEVPVWKSTYRIVFPHDGNNAAILQGWAVVDNTIGSDWDNVQLSLVAGAPQSFIQELSQPLYLRRPEIPISTVAMTTPQTHEAAEMNNAPPPQAAPRGVLSAKSANQQYGLNSSQQVIVSADAMSISSNNGLGGSSGGAIGRIYGRDDKGDINRPSDAIQEGDVSTNSFDDFFEYRLSQPVTIHKNESAMVPILQEQLPAERVTLWSAAESTPFRAVWLTNASKLTFDRGSFSIFESGVFAGQGLLDPIHPGEKRLLSYAVDQAIRVKQRPQGGKHEIRGIRITAHGFIMKRYAAESRTNYEATSSAEEPRVVVIEVPRQLNRKLSPESKAAEIAPTLYRFRIPVDAHKTASLLVADEGTEFENWKIEEDSDQIKALELLSEEIPAISDKLKPIIAGQREIAAMKKQLAELDQKSAVLASDEARARENLTALKGNDAGKRFVEELNHAEDGLQTTRKQTADLKEKEKAAVASLGLELALLRVDWSMDAK